MSPILVLVATVFGSTQVGGGSGSASRLQAAIDACPTTGCEIELTDSVYRMENQVWIQDKEGVRLRSTGAVPATVRATVGVLRTEGEAWKSLTLGRADRAARIFSARRFSCASMRS